MFPLSCTSCPTLRNIYDRHAPIRRAERLALGAMGIQEPELSGFFGEAPPPPPGPTESPSAFDQFIMARESQVQETFRRALDNMGFMGLRNGVPVYAPLTPLRIPTPSIFGSDYESGGGGDNNSSSSEEDPDYVSTASDWIREFNSTFNELSHDIKIRMGPPGSSRVQLIDVEMSSDEEETPPPQHLRDHNYFRVPGLSNSSSNAQIIDPRPNLRFAAIPRARARLYPGRRRLGRNNAGPTNPIIPGTLLDMIHSAETEEDRSSIIAGIRLLYGPSESDPVNFAQQVAAEEAETERLLTESQQTPQQKEEMLREILALQAQLTEEVESETEFATALESANRDGFYIKFSYPNHIPHRFQYLNVQSWLNQQQLEDEEYAEAEILALETESPPESIHDDDYELESGSESDYSYPAPEEHDTTPIPMLLTPENLAEFNQWQRIADHTLREKHMPMIRYWLEEPFPDSDSESDSSEFSSTSLATAEEGESTDDSDVEWITFESCVYNVTAPEVDASFHEVGAGDALGVVEEGNNDYGHENAIGGGAGADDEADLQVVDQEGECELVETDGLGESDAQLFEHEDGCGLVEVDGLDRAGGQIFEHADECGLVEENELGEAGAQLIEHADENVLVEEDGLVGAGAQLNEHEDETGLVEPDELEEAGAHLVENKNEGGLVETGELEGAGAQLVEHEEKTGLVQLVENENEIEGGSVEADELGGARAQLVEHEDEGGLVEENGIAEPEAEPLPVEDEADNEIQEWVPSNHVVFMLQQMQRVTGQSPTRLLYRRFLRTIHAYEALRGAGL